jgi:hypothetical protein
VQKLKKSATQSSESKNELFNVRNTLIDFRHLILGEKLRILNSENGKDKLGMF